MKITNSSASRCASSHKARPSAVRHSLLLLLVFSLLIILLLSSCTAKKPGQEKRYAVLSPEVAEIMAALGLKDDIVGLTEECTYPPDFASIPKIGKFGMVRVEEVLKLEPEIVFTSGLEQDAISGELQKLNIKVVSIYPHSFDDMYAGITTIGEITNRQGRAQTLVSELKAAIKKTTDKTQNMIKPRVYFEINRDPLMSASDESFVGKVIAAAGGTNIFPTLERDYARVKSEDVITAAPDIIICFSQDSVSSIVRRKGWQNVPAIKNGAIYTDHDINPDLIQRAGPRIHHGVSKLHSLFQAWGKTQRP